MTTSLREVLANFRVKANTRELDKANKKVETGIAGFKNLAAAAGLAFGVRAIRNAIVEQIQLGDELGKTSKQLGISVQNLQKFQFAADRSGVDSRAFNQSLMRLQRGMYDANRGSAEASEAFSRLGLSVKDSRGELKTAEQFLPEVAEAFKGLESSTERVALAQVLMGRSGARLLPMLDEGGDGIRALFARFEELGGGMDEEFTANAEKAQDALTDFGIATTSLKTRLIGALFPALTGVARKLSEVIAKITQSRFAMGLVKGTLIGLGAVVASFAAKWLIAFAPIIAQALLVAAGFAAVYLIVDDLIAMFEGRRSVIARFIDDLLGVGTAKSVVEGVKMAFDFLEKSIKNAFGAWRDLSRELKSFGFLDTLKSAFEGARMTHNPASAGGVMHERRFRTTRRIAPETLPTPAAMAANLQGVARPNPSPNMRATGSSNTINQGPTTVNVNGAQDPQATAQAVRKELDRRNTAAAQALMRKAPKQ